MSIVLAAPMQVNDRLPKNAVPRCWRTEMANFRIDEGTFLTPTRPMPGLLRETRSPSPGAVGRRFRPAHGGGA